jgi:dipeptidyl aminopeptidase/acylaminoacyl peptidase
MTTWTVGHTDRFRAAYVGAPVSDLVSFFGTAEIPLFAKHEIGGWPWETMEAFRNHSPLTSLPDCHTPVLLLHREGDLRCPIGQSEQIFQTLKLLGREVEFARYPGGSHGVATPSQNADQIERIIAWYRNHGAVATPVAESTAAAVV